MSLLTSLACSLMALLLAAVDRSEAVQNCWSCDSNIADCHNPLNFKIVTCATGLGNPNPCYKHEPTGTRGCAAISACGTYTTNIRPIEFDVTKPWLWVVRQLFPINKNCYSPTAGCNGMYCCREMDRCNSANNQSPSSWLYFATTIVFIFQAQR